MISNHKHYSSASEPTGAGLLVLVGLGVGLLGYIAWQAFRERKRQREEAHPPEPKAPDPRTQPLSPPMDPARRSGLVARARAWAEATPEASEFELARALWRSSWPDVPYPHPPRDDDHPSLKGARAFVEIAAVSARTRTTTTNTESANPAKGLETGATEPTPSTVERQNDSPAAAAPTAPPEGSRAPLREAVWVPRTDDEVEGLVWTAEAQLQANPSIASETLAEQIWRTHWPDVPCPSPAHPEDHPSVRTAARIVGAVVLATRQELAA